MISFALGVAVGAAFAPFWLMLYAKYIKPTIERVTKKD